MFEAEKLKACKDQISFIFNDKRKCEKNTPYNVQAGG